MTSDAEGTKKINMLLPIIKLKIQFYVSNIPNTNILIKFYLSNCHSPKVNIKVECINFDIIKIVKSMQMRKLVTNIFVNVKQ